MGTLPEALRQARAQDFKIIIGLIDAAAQWLRGMGTDQWARPWPSEAERDKRIKSALRAGKTWIAWDGQVPAATVTADPEDSRAWPSGSLGDPALYVSRLVVSRGYSGQGLGAWLLDWAAVRARSEYGARWLRVDVWTSNTALHDYYKGLGFDFRGLCESIPDYPSAALFQRPTGQIRLPGRLRFKKVQNGSNIRGRTGNPT